MPIVIGAEGPPSRKNAGRVGQPPFWEFKACHDPGQEFMKRWASPPDCRGVDPLSLPRPLLTLHHYSSQYPVHSRLVTRTFGLEPVDHFGIHAQRDPSLAWTVPPRLCAPFLLRQQQQVVLNRCSQLDNFPTPRPPLSPLCFLGLRCHDTIVYPLLSRRYVPAGTWATHDREIP